MASGAEKRRIYEDVVHYIHSLITSGRLGPGDKVPPERRLAEELQVSRNSVREAIRALSENGVLTSRQGAGTFICSIEYDSLVASLANVVNDQRERLEDIFEFRKVVEPSVAALAARRITPDQLVELKVLITEQQSQIAEGNAEGLHDAEFHMAIASASGNTVFREVIDILNKRFSDVRSQGLLSLKRSRESVAGHQRILEALEKADESAAFKAMEDHLQRVEENVFI